MATNKNVYTIWVCATFTGKRRYKILTNGCLYNGHPTFTSIKRAEAYIAKLNAQE